MKLLAALFLLTTLSASAFAEGNGSPAIAAGNGTPAAAAGNGVIDPTAMDQTADPCGDFYQYACGNWLKRTALPGDQSRWARSFSVLSEQNLATLRTMLEGYAAGQKDPAVKYAKKLGDYYASCMNEEQIEQDAPAALAGRLKLVDKLKDRKNLPAVLAELHLAGVNALFDIGSMGDLKQPTLEIASIHQGGMGLNSADQYTKADQASEEIRKAYRNHLTNMFRLAGEPEAQAAADANVAWSTELRLAQNALPPSELQDPTKLYHPSDFAGFKKQLPSFDAKAYLTGLGIANPRITSVEEPKFISAVDDMAKSGDLANLRTYLKLRVMESMATQLGKGFRDEQFDFFGKILNGQKEQPPRWKICVRAVSGGMSEALGQAFVARTFSPSAKKRVEAMIMNLRASFKQDLETLDWLDDATRAAALEKLSQITQKVGYPEHFRNYDKLSVTPKSYWKNALASRRFETLRDLHKINGKVDPTEWDMSPQTVNAYYDPNQNNINFPAGILQPPFFSDQADDASNYGSIGMVIGHEMTHGFDTSGSKFDGHGMEKDWWSPAVKSHFEEKAQCIIDQYSRFEPLPGVNVNGKLTVTENIADNGGLKLAYNAYKLSLGGKPGPGAFGLSGEQEYFVAMAQDWCTKQTDASLRQQVTRDPHSPSKFRVIGPMSNNAEFAGAFKCKAGAPMVPAKSCAIW